MLSGPVSPQLTGRLRMAVMLWQCVPAVHPNGAAGSGRDADLPMPCT